ncbi:MAG: hypothetical protein D3906_13270 [Candidatus Electrothrix sp. AUS1_2]|nr:hypothetical protein [Candidatus Electrothrix sp. AUS1_2]
MCEKVLFPQSYTVDEVNGIIESLACIAWRVGMDQYMLRSDAREIGSLIAREIRQQKRLKGPTVGPTMKKGVD